MHRELEVVVAGLIDIKVELEFLIDQRDTGLEFFRGF